MRGVSYHILTNLLKNKAIIIYAVLLVVLGWGMFILESLPEKATLSLLQISLIVVPLMTGVFATMYYYNSSEFIRLLLVQPVKRKKIISGFYVGLISAFTISYLIGIGLPLLLFYPTASSILLTFSGLMLSVIFTSLSIWVCTYQQDKSRSMGIVLLIWLFFCFIFDGILLWSMYQFADYPIETTVLISTFFNPVSIARILVVMQTEAAALLGFSGAIFQDFFGSIKGSLICVAILLGWGLIPYYFIRRKFQSRDF